MTPSTANRHSFIAYIPNTPAALELAAAIITKHNGNINRINFDRQIDSHTAFLEVTCSDEDYQAITNEFLKIGYFRESLKGHPFLKISVKLPNRTGALAEFLKTASDTNTSINAIDFDDAGTYPDTVFISMNLEDEKCVQDFISGLHEKYDVKIVDYSATGTDLDNTIFYAQFASRIKDFLQTKDEKFLMKFVNDVNHTVQELTKRGEKAQKVFDNYIECGDFLLRTSGQGFYADVQEIRINLELTLFCFQLPGGGSIYIFDTTDGLVMIDTGYGIYAEDVAKMFSYYGLDINDLKFIIVTHADADHCGAGGAYDVFAYMHPGTQKIIQCGNRAWGSIHENSVLEKVYTTMIAEFSHWNPSNDKNIRLFPEDSVTEVGGFPLLAKIPVGNITLDILLSDGGHQFGQLILYSEDAGLLFTADTLMNFTSFSESRRNYNSIADFLVTSVNVNSELARKERKGALALALAHGEKTGHKCLICGGHGTVSVLNDEGKLETLGTVEHYTTQ